MDGPIPTRPSTPWFATSTTWSKRPASIMWGLGSDFDGATIPVALGDVTGLPRLIDALGTSGYGEEDLNKLAHGNWIRVLEATWGE